MPTVEEKIAADARERIRNILFPKNWTRTKEDELIDALLVDIFSQVRADQRENDALRQLRAANLEREKEWDAERKITDAYRGNELAGEVGEACNVLKKLEREKLGIRGTRATTEQLAEELADVVICVDLIAMQRGIDLSNAIVDKFNATSAKYGLSVLILPAAIRQSAGEPRQSREPREGKELKE